MPATGDDCGGVDAQYIDLDAQVVGPESRTCFVLEQRTQVTVGAAALEPDDALVLSVRSVDGEELGTATSDAQWDPEVTLTLDPGVTIIEVTGVAAGVPPFLLYTATFPALSEQDATDVELPSAASCGDTTPVVADDAPVVVDESQAELTVHVACLEIEQPGFVKMGLSSAEPSDQDAPDLQLALYRAGAEPSLVRTGDDAIGLDPEMSLALEPGTYMLEATAWFDAPTGAFQFYVDDDADLFRHGEVTSLHADAAPEDCDGAPMIEPGDAVTIEGERTYVCLMVPSDARLRLEAATLTDQDLVLEIIGFEDSDAPYRLAWADEDPDSDALANFDPVIDQVIPAGSWLVAVTTYFTGTAADYDIALQPAPAG